MTNDFRFDSYVSPEQGQGSNASFPTDIFSFGKIIYFFYMKRKIQLFHQVFSIACSVCIKSLYHDCVKLQINERAKLD